jgi:hypothetical protein
MKENARAERLCAVGAHVIALGDVSVARKEIAVTHTRYMPSLQPSGLPPAPGRRGAQASLLKEGRRNHG